MEHETLGQFSHGRLPDIFLDQLASQEALQLVKAHEGEHRQLEYRSSYGMLLTFLISLEENPKSLDSASFLSQAIDMLFRCSFPVQEGCATYLTLTMCQAQSGPEQAHRMFGQLPEQYRVASLCFQRSLQNIGTDRRFAALVVKNLEFLMHGIALAALSSSICHDFLDPITFTMESLRFYLKENSPGKRLLTITEKLSQVSFAVEYLNLCCTVAQEFVGDEVELYNEKSMATFIKNNPVRWEILHRDLEMAVSRRLVPWFHENKIVHVDPTYDNLFTNPDLWSPFMLIKRWEDHTHVNTGLRSLWLDPRHVSTQKHIQYAHGINFSMKDHRKVLLLGPYVSAKDNLWRLAKAGTQSVVRLTYVPYGNDAPPLGIQGFRRFTADIAVYNGLNCADKTIRVDGLEAKDLSAIMPNYVPTVLLMTKYNHTQFAKEFKEHGSKQAGIGNLYIYFTPVKYDIFEHIATSRNPISFKKIMPFTIKGKAFPGICLFEERGFCQSCSLFCHADKLLLSEIAELMRKYSNVTDHGVIADEDMMRCAVEACYGIHSVLERTTASILKL